MSTHAMCQNNEDSFSDIGGRESHTCIHSDYATVEEENMQIDETQSEVEPDEAEYDVEHDEQRRQTISSLENIALSFMTQLVKVVSKNNKENENDNHSGPPTRKALRSATTNITLDIADRTKGSNADDPNVMHTKRIQFPRQRGDGGVRALAQLLRIVDTSHEALVNDVPVTKRDLYYQDVKLFKSQSTVNSLVDDLAATFGVDRADLNIRASAKGLFCGSSLNIHLLQGGEICGQDTEGSLIPVGEDIAEFNLVNDIAWVLIVEKDAVFQTLCNLGFTRHPDLPGPGILVTGKGYPDIATRQLVKSFSDNLRPSIPLLVLVDADPYGIDIASVYKFGSQRMKHQQDRLAAERVEWIGISYDEAIRSGIGRDALLPISPHDYGKAIRLLREKAGLPQAWRRELTQMLHVRRKAEIEIFSSANVSNATTNDDSQNSVTNGDDSHLQAGSLLVQYLLRKINSACHSEFLVAEPH